VRTASRPVLQARSRTETHLLRAGDAKSADDGPHLLLANVLPILLQHVLQRRQVVWQQVGKVLVVLPDAQVVVPLDHAIQRVQLPRHQLQQRRLAGTVRAHLRGIG
jgi:hypothetical protein